MGLLLMASLAASAQNDVPTEFTNMGGIANIRHSMLQNTMQNGGDGQHPKPLWWSDMRLLPYPARREHRRDRSAAVEPQGGKHQLYDIQRADTSSMTQAVYSPGAASLTCLSCHDGSQAVDAVMNMPGSGNYSANAEPGTWAPPSGFFRAANHMGFNISYLNTGAVGGMLGPTTSCMSCHNPGTGTGQPGEPTDFTAFNFGTDLRNDHPVGVTYPITNGTGTDWNTPVGTTSAGGLTFKYFDENSNGRMEKGDIRLYDSGNRPSVECATCHDPHGVPSGGAGSQIFPTFLRKSIADGGVCMTCHAK